MSRALRKAVAVALAASMTASCAVEREKERPVLKSEVQGLIEGKPKELIDYLVVYQSQGQRNRVLNANRIGLASLGIGQTDLARQMFDEALTNIEAIYANTEEGKLARSVFYKESVKDFKGEPYERSMAFFYRGLIYLMEGDYDNARASFLGGDLQNTMAADDNFPSVFTAFPYLQGWSAQCAKKPGLAESDFKIAQSYKASLALPEAEANLLVIAETGEAPIKYSAAIEDAESARVIKFRKSGVAYQPRLGARSLMEVASDPARASNGLDEMDDVFFQATTRGGRAFDGVLKGKAVAKATAQTVSGVAQTGAIVAGAIAAGAMMSGRNDNAAIAGIAAVSLVLASMAAQEAARAIEVDADARYWDNLPQKLFVKTMKARAGASSLDVDFLDKNGFVNSTRTVPIKWAGRCGVAWVRSHSPLPKSPRAPYSVAGSAMTKSVIADDPVTEDKPK